MDLLNPLLTELSVVIKPKLAHPFIHGWIPNRLDLGADGTFKYQIYAPFAAQVLYAGVFNGWNGSHGVILKARSKNALITDGVPTRCLYFTEGVGPLVRSGQWVKPGQAIAKAVNSPYGDSYGHGALGAIEWGVAADGPVGSQTNAYAIQLGTGSNAARQMVLKFSDWFQHTLGVSGPSSTGNAGSP